VNEASPKGLKTF